MAMTLEQLTLELQEAMEAERAKGNEVYVMLGYGDKGGAPGNPVDPNEVKVLAIKASPKSNILIRRKPK
jgi:hypothetical protein